MGAISTDRIGAKGVSVVSGSNVNNILHYDAVFPAPFLIVIENVLSS